MIVSIFFPDVDFHTGVWYNNLETQSKSKILCVYENIEALCKAIFSRFAHML